MSELQTGSWVGVRFPRLSIITCSLTLLSGVPFQKSEWVVSARLLLFFDREVLPRAGGSITDVRITPEGTSAAEANAYMLHIWCTTYNRLIHNGRLFHTSYYMALMQCVVLLIKSKNHTISPSLTSTPVLPKSQIRKLLSDTLQSFDLPVPVLND